MLHYSAILAIMLVITNLIVEKFMQLNGSNPIIVENSTKFVTKK